MRQDQKAMEELYTSQSDRVYRVALRITRQGAAAEEVLQDTFWQVWRQAPRFDPLRGSVSAWLLAIARSRAIDMVRASVRDPVQCCASPLDPEDTAHASLAADPVERLHDTRRSDHLHLTLAALSPLRRQLLSLAYFQGLTHSEIACHMDLPLGTVKTHCRRALAAMRLVLDRQSGAPQRPCV